MTVMLYVTNKGEGIQPISGNQQVCILAFPLLPVSLLMSVSSIALAKATHIS
jgi:hypothetical protein